VDHKLHLFQEAINLYSEKGFKFTMDELAARLFISKKTLYEMVRSKEDLVIQVIEYYFDGVEVMQNAVHNDSNLSNIEKLKKLLCATPDIPMRRYHLQELKMTYPEAYQVLDNKLRLGWERTALVIDQAKKDGVIRDINNELFSRIYASAIEEIIRDNDIDTDLTFRQRQEQIVDMLLFGICFENHH
jgi:AcrR family transcriptional regulator